MKTNEIYINNLQQGHFKVIKSIIVEHNNLID